MDESRVTLAMLAEELGLTKMSVSRALRGARGVSPATRKKVWAMARKMSYVPDAAISKAMVQVRRNKTSLEPVAWLTSHRRKRAWQSNFVLSEMHAGAEQQAARMGYQIEEFCINEKGMTPRRMGEILFSRGIKGILIAPLMEHGSIRDFPWQHFAAVACGQSLAAPALNRVVSDQFSCVDQACRKLASAGCRRIGLVVSHTDNERCGNLWLSSFLGWQANADIQAGDKIKPMVTDDWNPAAFLSWNEEQRPDAVLSFPEVYSWLRAAKIRVPEQCAFALLNFDKNKRLAGVDHRFAEIGTAAMSFLAGELQANHYGIPKVRQTVSLEVAWKEGPSVRSISRSK